MMPPLIHPEPPEPPEPAMPQQPDNPPAGVLLCINGGSSSIKFAAYENANPPRRLFAGEVERIGLPGTRLKIGDGETRDLPTGNHADAATQLIASIRDRIGEQKILGVGHRVVHGGIHLLEHQVITAQVVEELKRTQPLDLAHLPGEIALIEAFAQALPGVPGIACFDTAFHRDIPRVAQLFAIPRRYIDAGVRRFGFHGLSYDYLMEELPRVAGPEAARGKIIIAHLGSGASMAAVSGGKPVDTTMAFTPLAGLVMGTRPGDIDAGLLIYLMRSEGLTPDTADEFFSHQCGLRGLSDTSSDMRDLLAKRAADPRAADAVDLFCYQARKWIGALAAAMGGLDTLVFTAGIGQHTPGIRAQICGDLTFLGLRLDPALNNAGQPVISSADSRVTVRIIPTDEEIMIAKIVARLCRSSSRE